MIYIKILIDKGGSSEHHVAPPLLKIKLGPEAPQKVVVVMMLYDILNVSELVYMTRNIDGTIMMKFEFILSSFEQLEEQGMVDVHHWYHESLLILSFTHHHRHASSWDVPQFLNIILMMMMMKTRHMKFQMMMMLFLSHTSPNERIESSPLIRRREEG